MSRPLNLLALLLLAVLAVAVAAPLRQRRQLDPAMGGALTGYGNLYDGYGDNDDGTGNIFSVQVSQGFDNNNQQEDEAAGYGGYEDFGGYGGFEEGNRFV
ncbi:uncharacterized protein LOC124313512 isoform X2 [Daphnia pulicaria]|uniref:uncharacterized protein LOC124313512 isoform X2 n=1 Tax=Daphnia pulicaria TaxID=35523 RepID=UPI001EECE2B7|nr:uncharacterized protein LOC124313512 isoform X2 [Daphnia pulicaria]